MRSLLASLVALVLIGCPKPMPQPQPPFVFDGGDGGSSNCPTAGVTVSQDALCPNAFTATGLACVACAGVVPDGGCFMPGPAIYCVKKCSDPLCRKHTDPVAK